MENLIIESIAGLPVSRRRFEHVERKGIGHPDTICDQIADAASVALCRAYLENFGQVLHHNTDKVLLAAGQSFPKFGGGAILAPIQLYLGDRATSEINGQKIPVEDITETAAREWCRKHLRYVDFKQHLNVINVMRPGSTELVDIFARTKRGANDTSIGVGYAPLTETERLTLAAESYLNSPACKARYPEIGEDVKVMAVRRDRQISMTVAAAFVDRFIPDANTYFARKEEITSVLQEHLASSLCACDGIDITLNALDDPARKLGGIYLTVTGTSAEGADSGQVGRGNRANGLISPHRSMSMEAVAGKNPVSHVGKIYNILANQCAQRIVASIAGVAEVTVWLCSRIGRPIDDPWSVAVELIPANGETLADLEPIIRQILADELHRLPALLNRLSQGELAVC